MHEKQTESAAPVQYNSRRERRAAEGYVRESESLTRRQIARIRRAGEYLLLQTGALRDHLGERAANKSERPVLSIVDTDGTPVEIGKLTGRPVEVTNDLETHDAIISSFQEHAELRDWRAIDQLADSWDDMQPSEEAVATHLLKYDPQDARIDDIARAHVNRTMLAKRQHWMNQATDVVHSRAEDDYRRAA